jgi:alkylation response protein AidB-like acyl-CoA dehydrogenase
MTVELSDEENMLVETVRAFIDREVKPTVREVEHANECPEAWIDQMKRIGIYGPAIPEEYGGSPVSMPCYVEVTQELSRGWMSLAGAMGGHTVVAKLLTLFGTEDQKQDYLPMMASGALRATMALTEPGTQQRESSAERFDNGQRCDMEAGMAKLFASEVAMEIALNAVRIHGGYGYSTEFDVERYFRDTPLMIGGEGTNEIQRNVIASQLVARGQI